MRKRKSKKNKKIKNLSITRKKILQDWIFIKEILLSLEHEVDLGINFDAKSSRRKIRVGIDIVKNVIQDVKKNTLKIDKGEEE